ncbi:hypothetical protein D3C86_1414290 [compost metagenome]
MFDSVSSAVAAWASATLAGRASTSSALTVTSAVPPVRLRRLAMAVLASATVRDSASVRRTTSVDNGLMTT